MLVVFLLALGQRQSVLAQESHQVDHLVAFAKLSGDIQFFSPLNVANISGLTFGAASTGATEAYGQTDDQ